MGESSEQDHQEPEKTGFPEPVYVDPISFFPPQEVMVNPSETLEESLMPELELPNSLEEVSSFNPREVGHVLDAMNIDYSDSLELIGKAMEPSNRRNTPQADCQSQRVPKGSKGKGKAYHELSNLVASIDYDWNITVGNERTFSGSVLAPPAGISSATRRGTGYNSR
ncbi:hypothetical protein AMTRI_Chr11g93240 [Amborella trichopoda]